MTPESNARLFHVRILLQYLKALDPSVVRNLADCLEHEEDDNEEEWDRELWHYGQRAIRTISKSRLQEIEYEVNKILANEDLRRNHAGVTL
jgi:hypothetical protein